MVPFIPPEILGIVGEELTGYKTSLANCSLVSRSWSITFRPFLFNSIKLCLDQAVDAIVSGPLFHNDCLGRYDRNLTIVDTESGNRNSGKLATRHMPWIVDMRLLEELSLIRFDWSGVRPEDKKDICETVAQRVKHLKLTNCGFDFLEDFFALISSGHALISLSLSMVDFPKESFHPTHHNFPPLLQTLDLQLADYVGVMPDWIAATRPVPQLLELGLCFNASNAEMIKSMLMNTASSLVNLHMKFSSRRDFSAEVIFAMDKPFVCLSVLRTLSLTVVYHPSTRYLFKTPDPQMPVGLTLRWIAMIVSQITSSSFETLSIRLSIDILKALDELPLSLLQQLLLGGSPILQRNSVKLILAISGKATERVKSSIKERLTALDQLGRLKIM